MSTKLAIENDTLNDVIDLANNFKTTCRSQSINQH